MTILQNLKKQISQYLGNRPEQSELKKYLQSLFLKQSPKQAFHQLNLSNVKEPTLVYVKLMVQDIRNNCYSYPFLIKKPFSQSSQVYMLKYGYQQKQFNEEIFQNSQYFSLFENQETISCTPVLYESEWVRNVDKNILKNKNFEMIHNTATVFKLGEVISMICIYQPEDQHLYFIRKAASEQIQYWQNLDNYLSKEVDLKQSREKILSLFNQAFSKKYSQLLLYTLISTEYLFISADESHLNLFEKLLPRVCYLNIKTPFKESLFPYRKQQNQEEILVRTKMQLSNLNTFVIIDFSDFSKEDTVKIQSQQIDNIKALKVFVEQGQTIYRWLYGESLLDHCHTGLVVKASKLINPQYIIVEQQKIVAQLPQISESDFYQFRCYIHQARKINPILKNDRGEIQKTILSSKNPLNQLQLTKIMQLAKLNARSKGSQEITIQDYDMGEKLFF